MSRTKVIIMYWAISLFAIPIANAEKGHFTPTFFGGLGLPIGELADVNVAAFTVGISGDVLITGQTEIGLTGAYSSFSGDNTNPYGLLPYNYPAIGIGEVTGHVNCYFTKNTKNAFFVKIGSGIYIANAGGHSDVDLGLAGGFGKRVSPEGSKIGLVFEASCQTSENFTFISGRVGVFLP